MNYLIDINIIFYILVITNMRLHNEKTIERLKETLMSYKMLQVGRYVHTSGYKMLVSTSDG